MKSKEIPARAGTGAEICPDCKGVIYPFERENATSCICVPADYEQCAECGFDHEYDPREAHHAHDLIAWDAAEKFPQDQMTKEGK